MTEPFSLAAIKEAAERYADVKKVSSPYAAVTPAAVVALVEAVEASRELRSWQRQWESDLSPVPDLKVNLDDALEAFGAL